ncbi:uncharacterized protein METZ01_LOCUS306637 [marine metagenome]|uniref:Uncharacterized protein n=1 Tax=marine metagenome TaxID=408172 RepID=A0A382MXL3_9ZZZZ
MLLPATVPDTATLQSVPSRSKTRWIDLASGNMAPQRLIGPTLIIPK